MNDKMNEITLSKAEASIIRSALAEIQYEPDGNQQYISKIRVAAYQSFPPRIIDALEKQKSAAAPASHLVFTNLPIDQDIKGSPSFYETGKNYKSGSLSENLICAFGAILGEPYSIYFEGQELVNNLTPQQHTKHDYTGLGSEVELDFHIENAALKYMAEDDCSPQGICLLGIREDIQGPKTYVADARQALALLSGNDLKTLYGKNYIIRLPYRWRKAFREETENTELCSLISGPINMPRLSAVFYPDMVLPVNHSASKAFSNLYEAVKSVSMGINITPGKLLFIDNRFTLHSREKFSPSYDPEGCPYRWVQRLFITSSLWNFRKFTTIGERVFNPEAVSNSI